MIETILYFTRKDRLIDPNLLNIDEANFDDEITVIPIIITRCNKKIYLVYDQFNSSEEEKFSNFKTIWDKNFMNIENFAVFYHSTGTNNTIIKFIKDKTKFILKGSHENGQEGYEYYEPLTEIFINGLTEEKFENIAIFFYQANQTDEALDLLHNILNGAVIDKEKLPKELKSLFETHYNITEKYKDEYETQLVALRDAILEEKLANQH